MLHTPDLLMESIKPSFLLLLCSQMIFDDDNDILFPAFLNYHTIMFTKLWRMNGFSVHYGGTVTMGALSLRGTCTREDCHFQGHLHSGALSLRGHSVSLRGTFELSGGLCHFRGHLHCTRGSYGSNKGSAPMGLYYQLTKSRLSFNDNGDKMEPPFTSSLSSIYTQLCEQKSHTATHTTLFMTGTQPALSSSSNLSSHLLSTSTSKALEQTPFFWKDFRARIMVHKKGHHHHRCIPHADPS